MWSGGRLTKIQTTTRPDHVWPEVWTKIGKAAQNREEQEWKNEKPKLDNARRLRGIYFIDPDDQDYKETARLVSLVECIGLVGCRVAVFCGLGGVSNHSPLTEVSTGVLWVLTGTHPCGTSTQAGWWRYQSASSCVRQCWCWWCCTRGRAWSWWFYSVELSVIRTPPRKRPRALSFDLGTALARSTALTLSSRCKHNTSNDPFSRCKSVQ